MHILLMLATIILGLGLGFAVNLLADTLPDESKPICIHCSAEWELGDYLLLRSCAYCRRMRPTRFWIVLVAYMAFGGVFSILPPERVGTWWGLVLMAYFGVVFVIDLEHKLILRSTSLVGVLVCGYLGWIMHGIKNTLLGGLAGFGIMLVLFYFGIVFTKVVSRKRREPVDEVALGFGDVTLSFILGLLLGWPGITAGLFFAVLAGGLGGGIYLVVNKLTRGYKKFTAIPYAPFLLLGAALLVFILPTAP
jgi:prepilin signal peptidase PulO-like enzyme (type II secretory pathway)